MNFYKTTMGEWVKTDKCEIVARLMTAIHCSSYNEVKNVLDFSRTCGNSELIVNCHCGAMKVRPLQLASSLKNQQDAANIVKLLLDHGAKADCCDRLGRTPLHHAAIQGFSDVIKLLLDAGASPNSRYTDMPWGDDDDPFQCLHGKNCAREATAANDLPVPVGGRTPLHEAVKGGHITCVQILLEKDANVNASDENSLSPLLLASAEVTSGNNKMLSIERYENIVNQLVSKGANVNMTNEITKCTPLHYSVEIGSVTATTILIEKGASISSTEENGETCLHVAAKFGNIDVLCVILMNDCKNIINYPDKEGYTPMHRAAFSGNKECLNMLLNNGGDLTAETHTGLTVVDEIFTYLPRPEDFLIKILDSKITPNDVPINDHRFKITLDFDILIQKNNMKQKSMVSLLSEKLKIIQHPLIEAFIFLKWRKIKQIFSILFMAHVCFVIILTAYTYALVHRGEKSEEFSDIFSILHEKDWRDFFAYLLSFFGTLMLLQSTFELILLGPLRWTQVEPWLNFICPLYSIVLVYIALQCGEIILVIDSLCYVGSVVVLFGWARVMFLLARFPKFGYYGLMFLAVLTNVIRVLMSFICLIIGFVFCFCIQFPNNELFRNPLYSFVKTTTMMAGEFEYKDLFSEHGPDLYASRLVFLLFIWLATVVLMNLMVGLAVSDIKDLLIEGHVKCLRKQVEFVSHFEKFATHGLLKRTPIRHMLKKRHQVPTKLDIEPNAAAANIKFKHRLPDTLLEAIVKIGIRNEEKEKHGKKQFSFPPCVRHSYYDPSNMLRVSNILTIDGGNKSTPVERELYSQVHDIKHMLQFVIENQNNSSTRVSSDEDDEELNSKVYSLLRKMSQPKRSHSNITGRNLGK
ncbi:transient receptor potential channel pyrexia-like [Lycorma delicatula]|uniref:transient receptor potential channel pyrexia-like n=1 Tax=Lycorma delicatula TaxID=130591 RepID=UPI003F5129DD